jgi:hypothetical protein
MTKFANNQVIADNTTVRGYVRHWHKNGGRKFTLAVTKSDDSESSVYNVGIAVLNTKDKSYVKEKGRDIAAGRAVRHPVAYIKDSDMKTIGVKAVLDKTMTYFSQEENLQKIIQSLGHKAPVIILKEKRLEHYTPFTMQF